MRNIQKLLWKYDPAKIYLYIGSGARETIVTRQPDAKIVTETRTCQQIRRANGYA
jgi:hypothetical protein